MTLVQTEPKSIKIWTTEIKRVTIRPNGQEKQIRPEMPDYLCFTANTANSTVKLNKNGSPTVVTLETSTDGINWSTYTFGTTITLSNVWDKIYWRNTSESNTWFSKGTSHYYQFVTTWSMAASWDINYLLNKNSTNVLVGDWCYYNLFLNCSSLTSCPKVSATTLTQRCYYQMFRWCSNLETLPKLPAITLQKYCYWVMFADCTKIKLNSTQTWEYQTPYMIPAEWTWTTASYAMDNMFSNCWWDMWWSPYYWTPSINTTYYTSNTLVW